MAREIKVVSLSFLDLLCCAFGGTILLCFLMIASIKRSEAEAFKDRWLTLDSSVWLDVTDVVETTFESADPHEKALFWGGLTGDPVAPHLGEKTQQAIARIKQFEPQMDVGFQELPTDEDDDSALRIELNKEKLRPDGNFVIYSTKNEHPNRAGFEIERFQSRVSPPKLFQRRDGLPPTLLEQPAQAASGPRLLCRFDVQLLGIQLRSGLYFFNLSLPIRPSPWCRSGRAAAWMDLSGSGVAGHLVLSTHAELPEDFANRLRSTDILAHETIRQIFDKELALATGEPERFAVRRRLGIPDRYVPNWGEGKDGVAHVGNDLATMPLVIFDLGASGKWNPCPLALAWPTGKPFPDGSGFPVRPYRERGETRAGVWYHTTLGNGNVPSSIYLPGLCITGGHP